jgi:YHS domain-containing protein
MKPCSILSAFVVVHLALISCSKNSPETTDNTPPALPPSDDYPLTTCVVSGEKLGGMGAPVIYDHKGTTVKFCCKSCIPKFEADPEKFLTELK